MSYYDPEKDNIHSITAEIYNRFKERTQDALQGKNARLHFKDTKEMNASLFNIYLIEKYYSFIPRKCLFNPPNLSLPGTILIAKMLFVLTLA